MIIIEKITDVWVAEKKDVGRGMNLLCMRRQDERRDIVPTQSPYLYPVTTNNSNDMMSDSDPYDLRAKYTHFRILVIGQANAGKTTLLQRVCNTTEDPCIYDDKKNLVSVHRSKD